MNEDLLIDSIGHDIKAIDHLMQRQMFKSAMDLGLDKVTIMHGWIMGFLSCNSDRDIFQRDIESNFAISRSTVTSILKTMEKNGYIKRESVDSDARLKKLTLTQQGKDTDAIIQKAIEQNEERLNSLLTDSERKDFIRLAHKLRSGLENIQKGEQYD